MKNSKAVWAFLILSSIIGLYVGVGLLFFPISFQAQSEIILGDNISLLSDTRASGTVIVFASLLILLGIFRIAWTYISLLVSSLIFLSYGIGRILSLLLDGMPSQGLFVAMILELLIGFWGFILLRKQQNPMAE
ncbi:MAG: DUF4345 domain-containing protein [Bacteroidia bacterium]|nr:DUF4345 domain-containing protein [Bacteroidia bacterium]